METRGDKNTSGGLPEWSLNHTVPVGSGNDYMMGFLSTGNKNRKEENSWDGEICWQLRELAKGHD